MTVTIAAISGKGGTGKTTTVINLACALAERDKRVLAVDMDPQANLTSGIGYDPYHLERTVFQVLTGESPDGSAILSSKYKIDLLPSSPDLSAVESASTRVSFPRLPDIEEPDARIAVASAIPIGALTQPEPRLRRSRAMAGWYSPSLLWRASR